MQMRNLCAANNRSSALLHRVLLCIGFCCGASEATAHHSSITFYDRSGDIEITGTVTRLAWANPHVRMMVRVRNDEGDDEDWVLEAADAAGLRRRGMPKGVVKLGDRITAAGFPSTQGKRSIWTTNVLLADGREMLVYDYSKVRWTGNSIGITSDTRTDPVPRRNDPSPDIFGVWFSKAGFDGNVDAGVWGGDIELTSKGKAIHERYDSSENNPFISCTRGIPEIMTGFGPVEFKNGDDRITLRFEEFDIVRPIMMGLDAEARRPPKSPPGEIGAVGYSAGYWDGDGALVVRTSGMNFPYYDQSGLPQSPDAEIVERWSLADHGNQLLYELTVFDPEHFVKPVRQTKTWRWAPDQKVHPYNCEQSQ